MITVVGISHPCAHKHKKILLLYLLKSQEESNARVQIGLVNLVGVMLLLGGGTASGMGQYVEELVEMETSVWQERNKN
jgi:hypothetical protein